MKRRSAPQLSSLPQLWIRVNVVPHLPGAANSVSASRRSEASSSSLRVYLWLLNTDLAEQFRKSATRLPTQGGKDL